MGHNDKINKTTRNSRHLVPKTTSEYDLENNLKKFEPYTSHRSQNTININIKTCNFNPKEETSGLTSNSESYVNHTQTESGLFLNSYSKLDDKITTLTSQNESAHTALRQEFERKIQESVKSLKDDQSSLSLKIEDKLSTAWFLRCVAALATIASLFIALSYVPLLEDNKLNKENIDKTEKKQIEQGKEIDFILQKIDDIKNVLYKRSSEN